MVRVENLLSQQYLLNCDVLFSYLDRRSTTHFHPTSTDCLLCVDFERHLASVSSGRGAHFDRWWLSRCEQRSACHGCKLIKRGGNISLKCVHLSSFITAGMSRQ